MGCASQTYVPKIENLRTVKMTSMKKRVFTDCTFGTTKSSEAPIVFTLLHHCHGGLTLGACNARIEDMFIN